MDESTKQALTDGLLKAIQTERYGQHFYRMASKATADEKGQEVLALLADEEKDHEDFLAAHYRSLSEHGTLDPEAQLGRRADLAGENPIFSEKLKTRLQDAHREMTALGVGIQLELDSIRFYREQAEKAPSNAARTFFQDLAVWEQGHYDALLNQQETLKEDYWNEAGFAPF